MKAQQINPKELRRHFIESLYETLDDLVSPTPYLELVEGDLVDVRFLKGKPNLPSPSTTEVTILDIDVSSLFFDDFNILYEGVTGIGKTFTSDVLLHAIFGPEDHYSIRLSGGVLGSSALEPFTVTTMENGVPKTRIDPAKCEKYGALFIDEINRGDSQEVFQVVDGVIHLNGDTGYLRIPIPGTNPQRYKSVAIFAAMNPADAEHSSALTLDIAGENRFLKFKFPNGVAEAGSSQLEKKASSGDLYEQLWRTFAQRTGFQGSWREIYPLVTDAQQFETMLDGQVREFIDVALGYVGEDPKETWQRNIAILQQFQVQPHFSVKADNNYQKILETQGKLKHGFVRRDLRKIKDLSRLLGFIKGCKNKTYEARVGLHDVAASIGIVLESKTITGTDYGSLMTLVNDGHAAYLQMHKEQNIPQGYGIRQARWQAAMHAGQEHGFDAYIHTLRKAVIDLNQQATTAAQATLRSRLLADLVVLEHFSTAYEQDVKEALKEKGDDAFRSFEEIYKKNKAKSAIYEHRLASIMR